MAVVGINTKCFILALFIRDDNERFLLGDGYYEFKNDLKHFQANTIVNDVVEVQGNDGYLLAGQVRRSGTQEFNGYIADGTVSKTTTEDHRRQFFSFFRKNHFYKVVYVMPDGSAIQRKRGFLVDDPTVSEMYQQYPEYHVALNFEDINYYVYDEDSEGHEIYGKSAVIGLIQGLSGGLIWDALGAVSDGFTWVNPVNVSGANITIDNQLGAMVPIEDSELKGDTSQASSPTPDAPQAINVVTGEQRVSVRTGKNMIDLNAATTGYLISNTNGQLSVNANYSASDYIPVVADGHYYQTATNTWYSCYYDKNKNFIAQINSRNIRPTQDGYIRTSWENTKADQVMMEVGDSGTTYEPYIGSSHIVNLGKNLSSVDSQSNVTWGNTNNGLKDILNTFSAGTYTFSAVFTLTERNDQTDASKYGIYFANSESLTVIERPEWGNVGVGTSKYLAKTFTISEAQVGKFTNVYTYGCGIAGATGKADITEIQLEKSEIATPYTPYFTPIELAKIGTYQDYIYKSSGNWYVHKAINKVLLNGTEENWGTQNGVFRKDFTDAGSSAYLESIIAISNYFTGQSTRYRDGITDLCCAKIVNTNQIAFRYDALNNDVSAWTTWLSTHNTTVYYALATPTDTQITDATLISQLDALGAMRLYVGENNLSVSSASLPAILDFDYYSGIDYSGAGYEWEDGGTGGPETITVDSIDNVYPVWTVTGPALNPQLSVLTTNTTTTYAGTVAVGQTLVIDMFNKTATLNGTSVIGNVAGDWANFKPGNNRVIYSTNNADAPASKIEWQEVVG